MGFFPNCPNHNLPMLLKNGRQGAFWYCPDNCAHTQNFFGGARRVTAINGREVRTNAKQNGRTMDEYDSTSKVEEKAIRHVDEGRDG